MSWDAQKGGFYCDRCGAAIWLNARQPRFKDCRIKSDPHITVSRSYFNDEKRGDYHNALMYCFDCEPIVMEVLNSLNKEKPCESTKVGTPALPPSASTASSAPPSEGKGTKP